MKISVIIHIVRQSLHYIEVPSISIMRSLDVRQGGEYGALDDDLTQQDMFVAITLHRSTPNDLLSLA